MNSPAAKAKVENSSREVSGPFSQFLFNPQEWSVSNSK